jgi:hypothetical protein
MTQITSINVDPETMGEWFAEYLLKHGSRELAIEAILAAFTKLGIVVVYQDDTEKRRLSTEADPDTPYPPFSG